jgi:uncharacterized protein (TIGR02145 family)
MKQSVTTGLFLLLSVLGFSQGENNIWYFGNKAGLDFNTVPPTSLHNSAIWSSVCATVSISDSLGNLLFYSNGEIVWNRNHQIMPNGFDLVFGLNYSQPVFAVKSVGEDSIYYLFCLQEPEPPTSEVGLFYSVIDMRLNGGLGDIVVGMKTLPVIGAEEARDKLHGTRHNNNRDVWIVTKNYDTWDFAAYLISSTGISNSPVLSPSSVHDINAERLGEMKISQNGKKLSAIYKTNVPNYPGYTITEFCDFNKTTGVISPLFKFKPVFDTVIWHANYTEFSPDSKWLYIIAISGYYPIMGCFQYDASKTDSTEFMQSQTVITYSYGALTRGLQLAPDGKIYGCRPSIDSLSVINNPNIQGIGCNFQLSGISLDGRVGYEGLPQFIQRYKAYIHNSKGCMTDSISFSADIWPPPDSVHWNFGDPASGTANYSNLLEPSHLFSGPGSFTVEMWVRHIDKRTDTSWVVVNVPPAPNPVLGEDRTICTGDSVTFDAGYFSSCTYLWRNLVTGLPVGTGQTFTTKIAGIYEVAVTDINDCIGRDTVQLFVEPFVPVSVTISASANPVCTGTPVVFTASAINGGSAPFYQWKVNGTNTGTNSPTFIYFPVNGDCITCQLTSNLPCTTGNPATSNTICMTVTTGLPVSVSIAASANPVCSGTSVTFTAYAINGGSAPAYTWKVNGINTGSNSSVFSYIPLNGDCITCVLSSNLPCTTGNPATSNMICMTVNPNLPVSITISESTNPVCLGNPVTFTATPANGGTSPQYQWKVNGGNVGTNNPVYTDVPANGDLVWCILTSSEVCTSNNPASSIQHQMVVNPLLPVSVTISASSNPFCIGNSVTFTTTHTNGGTSPSYQWKVNGANVSNDTLYSYYPVNGDMVSCVFTSSASCVTGNPATSNTITMIGTPGLPAGVSINANPNPFCPGSSVTCTATPGNGGTNPVYQWKVNGVNVGINSPTYTYNPLNNDSVRCVMTSNLSCVSGNPATSNKIILSGTLAPIVTFTRCFDSITSLNAKPIKLKGGIPLGGTYSGPGVNSTTGVFTPSVAGIGTKIITYSYTNVALCSASKTKTIVVQSASSFTCGNNLTDIRDGKVYPTIQFGSQCWMASNLNYGNRVPSTEHQRDNCTPEKYCYNELTANCEQRGANYQWDELMRYDDTPGLQGFCPPGWHVPTEAEWNTLFANWTNNAFAGAPLKYSGYSGFNALLSGVRHLNVQWDYQNVATFFWSSTPYGAYKAWAHGMNDYDPSVAAYPSSRVNAFSIRCIKDY